MKIAIAEAKAQFAELIRRTEAGEAIELTCYGRPLIGAMEGAFTVPEDVFAENTAS